MVQIRIIEQLKKVAGYSSALLNSMKICSFFIVTRNTVIRVRRVLISFLPACITETEVVFLIDGI
jgi:hypothetical protein